MYQVIARKYRPQTFSELIGQEHVRTTLENAIAEAHRPRLHFFGAARHRQDHRGAHPGPMPELRAGSDHYAVRQMRELSRDRRRLRHGRHRDRRRLQPRHQRNARAARERALPPGARSLQGLHRRRSAPDHQRGLQRPAENPGGAAGVGGLHSLHHRGAQDSVHDFARDASSSPSARWISPSSSSAWNGSSSRRAFRPIRKR